VKPSKVPAKVVLKMSREIHGHRMRAFGCYFEKQRIVHTLKMQDVCDKIIDGIANAFTISPYRSNKRNNFLLNIDITSIKQLRDVVAEMRAMLPKEWDYKQSQCYFSVMAGFVQDWW
jgi:hypothetical protein